MLERTSERDRVSKEDSKATPYRVGKSANCVQDLINDALKNNKHSC